MNKIEHPIQSTKSLIKATLAAILLALLILITAVLPAEYGIDPTGLGKVMGLTVLATPAEESSKTMAGTCDESAYEQDDSVTIVVPAQSGLEYKFYLEKAEMLNYSWQTDGGELYFDFHGEPKGDKTGYFKSFEEATANQQKGSLTTPFAGSHGWYWKNTTRSPVTLVLKTQGNYQIIGLR
ncbi:MAG: hypothetical protein V7682_06655 [Cycloclasticus sp.]